MRLLVRFHPLDGEDIENFVEKGFGGVEEFVSIPLTGKILKTGYSQSPCAIRSNCFHPLDGEDIENETPNKSVVKGFFGFHPLDGEDIENSAPKTLTLDSLKFPSP